MSVAEAMERIDSREFTLWRAAYRLEPWGEERADLRAATLAHYITASQSWKLSYTDIMKSFDFSHYDDAPPKTFKQKFHTLYNTNAEFLGVAKLETEGERRK